MDSCSSLSFPLCSNLGAYALGLQWKKQPVTDGRCDLNGLLRTTPTRPTRLRLAAPHFTALLGLLNIARLSGHRLARPWAIFSWVQGSRHQIWIGSWDSVLAFKNNFYFSRYNLSCLHFWFFGKYSDKKVRAFRTQSKKKKVSTSCNTLYWSIIYREREWGVLILLYIPIHFYLSIFLFNHHLDVIKDTSALQKILTCHFLVSIPVPHR